MDNVITGSCRHIHSHRLEPAPSLSLSLYICHFWNVCNWHCLSCHWALALGPSPHAFIIIISSRYSLLPSSQAYPHVRGRAVFLNKWEDTATELISPFQIHLKIPSVLNTFRNNSVLNLVISSHSFRDTLAFGIVKTKRTEKWIKQTCTCVFHSPKREKWFSHHRSYFQFEPHQIWRL